ncbi:ABC transporter substrate-binding protein [Pseudoalteromonas sp. Of7M-16]|uniref:ABC transporter substrate-binding protein n=1 Tax=Pseudoalteromonas sp. Of7M-16 TaxID=2917756 RepID=UPI001EF70149|nr:ABC transporter substrate-binding protein [Pseudoalteromonas sp. Of7M-16]MCG7550534.1 ABC transporter substrate-binding protein [Pseudoalteromonas sp. Of7M-16]
MDTMSFVRCFSCVLVFVTFSSQASYFVFVNPSNREDQFWNHVTNLVIETAKDLNVRLDVEYAGANRIHQSDLMKEISARKSKPVGVIFMPYDGSILKSFQALESAKIPFVTLEQVYNRSLFPDLGYPMEKYTYWLGEYTYDNYGAATKLTQYLIDRANSTLKAPKNLYAVGFGGDFYQSSINRLNGFTTTTQLNENVTLNHVLPANWQRGKAKQLFKGVHSKYGETHIVFCASDLMALGVIEGAKELGLTSNKQIFIGGFDWMPEALKAIENKTLTASMGGHFIQASMALIDFYDHLHGVEIYSKGDKSARVPMYIVHENNIDIYLPLFDPKAAGIADFSKFSRHWAHTHGLKHVPFTVDNYAIAVSY